MTESEKIAYAKMFIDKLANGINPLDDTPIPDGDVANNIRLSRCFFYVSEILRQAVERERKKEKKKLEKELKKNRVPLSLTEEELQKFEYTDFPINSTLLARKINALAGDLRAKNMARLSRRNITKWFINMGMIEWREWEDGKYKRYPTKAGEEAGLVLKYWNSNGKNSPIIEFSKEAQKLVIDNIEAVIETAAVDSAESFDIEEEGEE